MVMFNKQGESISVDDKKPSVKVAEKSNVKNTPKKGKIIKVHNISNRNFEIAVEGRSIRIGNGETVEVSEAIKNTDVFKKYAGQKLLIVT